MNKIDTDKLTKSIERLWTFSAEISQSLTIIRWIGYSLLVLALFDLVDIFLPPRFMNPVWEFQTLGGLVERVPVPLIGLGLVFLGEHSSRTTLELAILKFLSWLTCVAGILFFLLIPLGVVNTIRIDQQSNQQLVTKLNQQITQIQQVKEAVTKTTTTAEMEQLLSRLDNRGRTPQIKDSQQFEEVKQQLSSSINQSENQIKNQAQSMQSFQRMSLLKNSVKWNLGALISGSLFIYIWRATSWVRRSIP